MTDRRRFVAVLAVAAAMSVLPAALPTALPALGAEAGPFPYRAPPPGTLLVYDDGFEVAFGPTTGRVTSARAGPKSAPRAARVEIEDSFMLRRIRRGARLVEVENTVEPPGFWPLVPGATRRYRMVVTLDGKPRETRQAVARIANTVSSLTLAGKPRRVIRLDIDIRWTSPGGKTGRLDIVYWHDLDLGYYVKRSYARYGPEGRPRAAKVRSLARVGRAAPAPRR